ncbi:MAG: acyl carrier protein [Mycobacterium sp.]
MTGWRREVGANRYDRFLLTGQFFGAAQPRLQYMTVLTQESTTLAVVTQEIIDLVRTEADEVDLTADSILLDAGLDSLRFMSVVFKIEAHYDIELQEEDADDLRSVADLATLVVGRIAEQS